MGLMLAVVACFIIAVTVITAVTMGTDLRRSKIAVGVIIVLMGAVLIAVAGILATIVLLTFLAILLGAGYVTMCLFIQWISTVDLLFTTMKMGTRKVVLAGDTWHRAILAYKGHHLNDPSAPYYRKDIRDWEVLDHTPGNKSGFTEHSDEFYDRRPALFKRLGVYWIGFPWAHKIRVHFFQWNETKKNIADGTEVLWPREAYTSFDVVQPFSYRFLAKDVEAKDLVRLTLGITLIVRQCNAYLPDHGGTDFMKILDQYVQDIARKFAMTGGYKEILAARAQTGGGAKLHDDLATRLLELNDKLPDDVTAISSGRKDGLIGFLGVLIESAMLISVELSGADAEKLQGAATAAFVAENEKKATIIRAEGEAEKIKLTADAEAAALVAKAQAMEMGGDAAEKTAALAALTKPEDRVIVVGDPVGAFSSILGSVGRKKP